MTYVKIHEDMYLEGYDADAYVNDAVGNGCCFYGNRDYGFVGSDEMKSIYDAVNKYVDDETEIEDLEYYFNVNTDKAEEIHRILDMCYHLRQIPERELFPSIAEVVMDTQFYSTTLRGSSQGDWEYCLIPSDIYSDEYEDYLNAVWWGTGEWVEISEDSPYFDDTVWDYVAIPYPTKDEIKKYLEDSYGPVKIVDVDWDYDEDNSPHDADNLYDDTTYDFESVRRRSIKESTSVSIYDDTYSIIEKVCDANDLMEYEVIDALVEDHLKDVCDDYGWRYPYDESCDSKKTDKKDTKEEAKASKKSYK